MLNLRPFEIALIGIFSAVALGALVFVSLFQAKEEDGERPYGDQVIIWGPFSNSTFTQLISDLGTTDKAFQALKYKEVDPRSYEQQLLTAIAEGVSPDLVILPSTLLVSLRSILIPISYQNYPVRTYKDTYIDGAEMFMLSDGLYGIPFAVDPLVVYWNRDIFSSAGISSAPSTWESLVQEVTPAMVRQNQRLELTQSAVALGEYSNVTNAKEIITMLLLQGGSDIVSERAEGYAITINNTIGTGLPPGPAAFSFYTQFASPRSTSYSWNRSQAQDKSKFLGGTLGMYFGLGSEYRALQKGNPNLNFDIAVVPQGSAATTFRNYGTFYAFAIPRAASKNFQGAYRAALVLAEAPQSNSIIQKLDLGPVHRSIIAQGSNDQYRTVLNRSSLIARGWLDPDPVGSSGVLRSLVEEITSGRANVGEALAGATQRLQLLFK
jgi:hypothetical protein